MDENQSICSVNKYPEVTKKVLHCYTSTSNSASGYCLQSFYMHNGLSIYLPNQVL